MVIDVLGRAGPDSGFVDEEPSLVVIHYRIWAGDPMPTMTVHIGDDYSSALVTYDLSGRLVSVG